MWFRLALGLGMTVAEAQARIDSREFAEWMAYYCVEPFGEEVADLRMGTICATVASFAPFRKPRSYKPADFMPLHGRGGSKMSPEQVATNINQFFQVIDQMNAKRAK